MNMKCTGWTQNGTAIEAPEGYHAPDYFRDGKFLGPDADGIEPVIQTIKVGDRVQCGDGEDKDTGTVDSIVGDMAIVRWDSHVVTRCPVELLEAI